MVGNHYHIYSDILTNCRIENMKNVKGLSIEVIVGDKTMNGVELNPIHFAVYKNNLEALKLLV